MAAIGIATLPEAGHVNPTEYLRKELVECGHHVTYIVKPDQQAYYANRGLPFELLARPSGDLLGFRPDAVLIEAHMVDLAILAFEFRVPALKLSATFSQKYEPRLPPPTSDLFPDDSERGIARTARAWQAEHEKLKASDWSSNAAEWAQRHGFPIDWIDDRAAIEVTFRFPELTLAPAELDFDRDQTDLFYAGPCVDLWRDETERTPLHDLRFNEPIAYCAFGTQVRRYESMAERVRLVLEAARLLPRVTFVVSWDGTPLGDLPANLVLMRNAPQLALLRRSAVMLTHGGLNSVKEALCLGVPLIVLPFDRDQPGNAARVAFHGYGRKAAWESTSAAELAGLVNSVLQDTSLKSRVRVLSERFQQGLDQRQAAKAFERCWEKSVQFISQRPPNPERVTGPAE